MRGRRLMPDSFYVIHPKPQRNLPRAFVAHGRWLRTPAPLWGVVYGPGRVPVAVGRLVRNDRRCWTMVFPDVPAGQGYQLEITNPATQEVRVVDELSVTPFAGIIISYPTTDDLPVGTTFVAYGNTDVTSELSAFLTPTSGTVRLLFGPPDNAPYWAFEFDGVDVGGYTLTVQGGQSAAHFDIDVL
jgi:hypothetical protein